MDNDYLKDEYSYVSYDIYTPGYYDPETGNLGFEEAERIAFHADIEQVFYAAGWTIKGCYVVKGKSSLYLHPQQLLGFVHAELVDKVKDIIANGTTFKLGPCGMRIISVAYDVTAEQEHAHLMTRREEIENELLEAFRTKRRNLYRVPGYQLWTRIMLPLGQKHGIPAIAEEVNNAAGRFVNEVLSSLIREGKIHMTIINGNMAYRTVVKTAGTRKRKSVAPSDTPDLF